MLVEICANSIESAINAEKAGADRIELCVELGLGGITPSFGLLEKAREKISIPIHVLIRPRSGDFTYTGEEFEIMISDIEHCKALKMDGIVSGILHKDLTLDEERTQELIEAAGELKFTFHRAFDWIKEPIEAFEKLQNIGVNYVLTSGQKPSAIEGMVLLQEMLQKSENCKVLPGGGININNVLEFKKQGFQEIHLSATSFRQTLPSLPTISMNSEKFLREDRRAISDFGMISKIVEKLT